MKFVLKLTDAHAAFGRLLDHFRSLVLLGTRFYVGWQFWKSGALKLSSWSSTLDLFRTEYHVPVLPPDVAVRYRRDRSPTHMRLLDDTQLLFDRVLSARPGRAPQRIGLDALFRAGAHLNPTWTPNDVPT
jgi:hypothetical protein